jgi:hypothetical protein
MEVREATIERAAPVDEQERHDLRDRAAPIASQTGNHPSSGGSAV